MTTFEERKQIVIWLSEATSAGARLEKACAVLNQSIRTVQRWQVTGELKTDRRPLRQYVPPHKLSEEERMRLLAVANSSEFGTLPPSQIVPRLADQGTFIASESTFYRVLKAENQLAHRRADRPAQNRSKPRAIYATAPNQVYTWDITYLASARRGCFFYLYLFLDIFSRKIVGWQVYETENSALASEIMRDICRHEGVLPGQVTLHSDNGGPMKGATMLATLQELGVMSSFSRPAVSNDNPYSESLFKTLKYRPEYPNQPFEDLAAARCWVAGFVQWYNHEHRHSAIRFVTPVQRHAGLDKAILAQRITVYEAARTRSPQRWSRSCRNWRHIDAVHLNPDRVNAEAQAPKEVKTTTKTSLN